MAKRARATMVPGMSLHGGMSGSRYDRVEVKSLVGASASLGSTIKALVERNRARRAKGMAAPLMAKVTDEERAAIRAATVVQVDTETKTAPARDRVLLDQAHVDTLKIVFSLLDTDLDGKLTDGQLRTAVTAVGIPPTRRFLLELKSMVPRGEGVDFESFVRGVEKKLVGAPVRMQDIDELFAVVADLDPRDGEVDLAGMMHCLAGIKTTHNTQLDEREVMDIMAELHIGRGEPIVVRDFVKALSSGFVQFDEDEKARTPMAGFAAMRR